MRIGTLFTGFGGVEIGALAAGLEVAWGVEYRADVAEVANHNLGNHVIVADVLTCDPHDFAPVDVLHASPPCPNFSVAKTGKGETAHDIAMAAKVAEFVTVLQPQIFTLENVMAYRESKSWLTIEQALFDAGYWVDADVVNAADYGVPQTRRRLIVRAVRGGFVPYLPQPVEWVGWYAAIADLIYTLPDSQFAPWQLARLPDGMCETSLISQGGYDGDIGQLGECEPAQTITANGNQTGLKAFCVGGIPGSYQTTMSVVPGESPMLTVSASDGRHPTRAAMDSRIVAMTPRALARFQSFPDWYELPAKRSLAAYGIGNAVPPLMYQRIIEGMAQP